MHKIINYLCINISIIVLLHTECSMSSNSLNKTISTTQNSSMKTTYFISLRIYTDMRIFQSSNYT